VLRIIYGHKEQDVTEIWRKLSNEELYNWYSLPYIVRAIKYSRTKWVGRVVCMGETRKL
jgi:hypothetical protein